MSQRSFFGSHVLGPGFVDSPWTLPVALFPMRASRSGIETSSKMCSASGIADGHSNPVVTSRLLPILKLYQCWKRRSWHTSHIFYRKNVWFSGWLGSLNTINWKIWSTTVINISYSKYVKFFGAQCTLQLEIFTMRARRSGIETSSKKCTASGIADRHSTHAVSSVFSLAHTTVGNTLKIM